MGGRIVQSSYLVGPFANNLAIVNDHGTERAAAEVGDVLFGEGDRSPHEIIPIHNISILLAFRSNLRDWISYSHPLGSLPHFGDP
jgi:hypothetical protein